jgi:hypothetical protein
MHSSERSALSCPRFCCDGTNSQSPTPLADHTRTHAPPMADRLVRFSAECLRQILADDERVPAASTLPYGPRYWRFGHADNDHFAPNKTADALADAESWRSILAEHSEAFAVFHPRGPTWLRPGTHFRVTGRLQRLDRPRLAIAGWTAQQGALLNEPCPLTEPKISSLLGNRT